MKNSIDHEVIVSGVGVSSSIGQGKTEFINALLLGRHRFDFLQRPGRQFESTSTVRSNFIGAELPEIVIPKIIDEDQLRNASLSSRIAVATLCEAWEDAALNDIDPSRVGLIIGGSNFQQREIVQSQNAYQSKPNFLRPSYGMCFLDTDICGVCTALFPIRAFSYTLGGASASGQIAFIQAVNAVSSGQCDICIALGVMMDISYWECQGFRSLGAMGSDAYGERPELAARPFDQLRDGFIFGENCGAIIVEKSASSHRAAPNIYARVLGCDVCIDGNRNPNPSLEGEYTAVTRALSKACLNPSEIDYINPHGSGSIIGDDTELRALAKSHLRHSYINTTKSIVGHGLSAAGTVELIATLLQMQRGEIHPSRNLNDPIDDSFNWVFSRPVKHRIKNSLNLSMGFGGINSAVCLQRNR